ncbi:MAG: AMP-binding protein [Muribaculaceae bacterium]|nr:AMP-binding protein [Muribaculaceae bacterium]
MAQGVMSFGGADIYGADEAVERFVREWDAPQDYVKAMTSGSTGKPKPIRLMKADMIASARATVSFFGLDRGSSLVMPLSADYIAGKMMIVRALVAGCPLYVEHPSMTPLASCSVPEVSLIPIVPSQIKGLLASPYLNRCSAVLVGGSAVSEADEQALIASGVAAYASYGMTETCSHVALRRLGSDEPFHFLPGFRGNADERGCLVIESVHMSFGRLMTNDIVRFYADGGFTVVGRADNVIISGGEKIHPEADEHMLAKLMDGRAYYIAPRVSERWGMEPVLVVEGDGDGVLRDRIICGTRELLPRHHVPKDVIFVERMERTSSGKIIRRKLH